MIMQHTMRYINTDGTEVLFSTASGYIITDPGALSSNTIDLTTGQAIGQVGDSVLSQHVQPRVLTITGFLLGAEAAKKEALLSTIRPGVPARLYFDDLYFLDVYATTTPILGRSSTFSRFQFALKAPYPYWQRSTSRTDALSGLVPAFLFPWNLTEEWTFTSMIETLFVIIQNTGQVEVPFTIMFSARAPVVNPKITNIVTGEWLRVNRTLVAGESVAVEITHSITRVSSSVDGDIRGDLDINSTLFRLHIGDNALKPEATSGGAQLRATITWAPERHGMVV